MELAKKEPVENVARAFGAFEYTFWLMDQQTPAHFVTAAVIAGTDRNTNWRHALDRLQERHVMLRARVEAPSGAMPYFSFASHPEPIPLRIVDADSTENWSVEAAAELAHPFDPFATPLLRAVVVQARDEAVLMLVTHHAIADGMSGAFLLRDMMQALSGAKLPPLAVLPPQDAMLRVGTYGRSTRPVSLVHLAGRRERAAPNIENMRFEPDATSRLRERAQLETSSVHGALCAALAKADQDSPEWQKSSIRILSPINARPVMGIGEECGLVIDSATTNVETGPGNFWERARWTTMQVSERRNRANMEATVSGLQGMLLSCPDVLALAEFTRTAFAREAMVTNLGVLPFSGRFGRLRLKAIWGPLVNTGLPDEHTIGAATLDGALYLTHTSYAPNGGLLAAMRRELLAAIAA